MFVITFARLYAEVCAISITEQVSTAKKNVFICCDITGFLSGQCSNNYIICCGS